MASKALTSAVLLASGGLDSTVLAYWLIERRIKFIPLFVDYGQHSRNTELHTLREVLPPKFAARIETVRLPKIYESSSSRLIMEPNLWRDYVQDQDLHLPHRNLLLIATGVAFAEARGIRQLYMAFIETHRASGRDCRDHFFQLMKSLLLLTGRARLKLPFKRYSKAQVARIGIRLNAPIGKTFSCLAAARLPCGACPNCVDRLNAFESLT